MNYSFKSVLKMGTTACLAFALVGPSVGRSQTSPSTPPPPTAPSTAPATGPTTGPAAGTIAAPTLPTDPCVRMGHVMGEKRSNWNSDNYLCEVVQNLRDADEAPQGLPGGVEKKIALPRGAYLTKVHVFSDAKRVYGLKFSYKLRGGPNDDETETDVIGGTSGAENVVELTYETPLHFIRPRFSPDPAGHYNRPVIVGLDIGYYKFNPLAPSYVADPTASFSHSEMIEVKRFGATGRGTPPVAQSGGFDIHLVQIIRGINACVSPFDRNGRIMSLGVTVSGLGTARNPAGVTMCPAAGGTTWENQPLGPPKLDRDDLGVVNPYKFVRGQTNPFDFASGTYARQLDRVERIGGGIDYRGSTYSEPQFIQIDFNDKAAVKFGGLTGTAFELPLILEDSRKTRDGVTYDFAYGNATDFIGVQIKDVEIRSIRRGVPNERRSRAFLTYITTQPGGRQYNGYYHEAPLGDPGGNAVAKRHRAWEAELAGKEVKESNKTLLSLNSKTAGGGYLYSGYDPIEMGLTDIQSGRKRANPIFVDSGPLQYYFSDEENKTVSDGLLYFNLGTGWSDERQTILKSEKAISDTVSRSISANVNIRGVTAGAKYARTESRTLSQSTNSVKGFGLAQSYNFALALDRPNVTLADNFRISLLEIYRQTAPTALPNLADRFVALYGTHYARSVIFGGMGISSTSVSGATYMAKREAGESFSVSGGVETPKGGGGGEVGQETKSTATQSNTSETSVTGWQYRGGAGSWGPQGFNVSDENAVPIIYDLRPLDDLIEPIILSKVLDPGEAYLTARAVATRDALRGAIERHFVRFGPPPTDTSTVQSLYKMTIKGLLCSAGGDDGSDGTISLVGKLDLDIKVAGVARETISVLDSPNVGVAIKCDQKTDTKSLSITPQYVWAAPGQELSATFSFDGYEDDETIFFVDDPIKTTSPVYAMPQNGVFDSLVLINSNELNRNSPFLYLDIIWEKVEMNDEKSVR